MTAILRIAHVRGCSLALTMVFLFTSSLLNPIIVVLMGATFGLRLTAIYVVAALGVSLCAGWLLHMLGFEHTVRQGKSDGTPECNMNKSQCDVGGEIKPVSSGCCGTQPSCMTTAKNGKYKGLWRETRSDFFDVLPYLLIGVAIGSAGASLTELVLLRSLFTLKLLVAFVAVILFMAMIAGYATFMFF